MLIPFRLELHLIKVVSGETWDNVVDGNNFGQFVFDPEQLSAINERLAPFTSDDVLVSKFHLNLK